MTEIKKIISNYILVDQSLAAKAADIIREMIIKGECSMGERLLEADFAEALQISRASVREAFMILENDGLLVRKANKSTAVVSFLPKDVEDMYQLRTAIEVLSLEKCMKDNLLDIGTLEELSKDIMRHSSTESYDDRYEWIKEDMRFHEMFVQRSDNMFAFKVWNTIKNQMMTLLYYAAREKPKLLLPQGEEGSHDILIGRILNGDFNGAADFLKMHIKSGGDIIKNVISRNMQ